MIFSLIDII